MTGMSAIVRSARWSLRNAQRAHHHRHAEIEQDRRRAASRLQVGQGLLAVARLDDHKTFDSEEPGHRVSHGDVIINEQDRVHAHFAFVFAFRRSARYVHFPLRRQLDRVFPIAANRSS